MTPRRWLWVLIAVSGTIRLAWASCLGLGNDEAYHSLFLRHLDWSYFDHPPILALVEGAGVALAGGRVEPITLRLGFVLLFAGSTWLMDRLGSRFGGERAGLFAALALNVSAYHTAAAGAFALPDGPLLFFWLLTLDRAARAVEDPDRLGPWVGVGLAWGGALLSKYHGVFLPVGVALYALLEPTARPLLRRPGPYLAVLIGLALFGPVIAWNARHDWASFAFQAGRASGSEGTRFQPDALVLAILGQAAYLFPWIWLALVRLLLGRIWAFRSGATPGERFLVCQAIVPLVVFTAVACVGKVLPHWILVGYLSIFPLLGRAWADRDAVAPRPNRRRLAVAASIPALAMAGFVAQYQTGVLNRLGLPVALDPTTDLYGWDQVAREAQRRGLLSPPGTFLFTSTWVLSGQMGFATRDLGVPALCYNFRDAHNFAIWARPEDVLGRDGLLVSVPAAPDKPFPRHEPGYTGRYFERIDPPVEFDVTRAGALIRRVRLYRCVRQTAPFPFDLRPSPSRP